MWLLNQEYLMNKMKERLGHLRRAKSITPPPSEPAGSPAPITAAS